MRLGSCANCSKKILIHGSSVFACKCRTLFCCSDLCYKVSIKSHKNDCPQFINLKPSFLTPNRQDASSVPSKFEAVNNTKKCTDKNSSSISGFCIESQNNSVAHPESQVDPGAPTQSQINSDPKPFSETHANSEANSARLNNEASNANARFILSDTEIKASQSSKEPTVSLNLNEPLIANVGERRRDRYGMFKKMGKRGPSLSEDQKKKNAIASRVKKYKDIIVANCKKIQELRYIL